MLFWKWNSEGKHGEIEVTSAFSTSPNLICCFELTNCSQKWSVFHWDLFKEKKTVSNMYKSLSLGSSGQ